MRRCSRRTTVHRADHPRATSFVTNRSRPVEQSGLAAQMMRQPMGRGSHAYAVAVTPSEIPRDTDRIAEKRPQPRRRSRLADGANNASDECVLAGACDEPTTTPFRWVGSAWSAVFA